MKPHTFSLFTAFVLMAGAASADPVSSIGYPSVADALQALRADPETQVYTQQGWTLASREEDGNYILWTFTPENHAAHPAVVKRTAVQRDGEFHIVMTALCQADKSSCDSLIEEFKALNERMRQDIEKQRSSVQ